MTWHDRSVYFDFASDTFGRVIGKGFSIPFGINKNDNVIAWLGDLKGPPGRMSRSVLHWITFRPTTYEVDFFDSQLLSEVHRTDER